MATTLTVAVPRGQQLRLSFPPRCVNCGADARTESTLVVTRLVANRDTGEQTPVRLGHDVPHCERCARATRAVFLAQLIPFLVGFLVAGLAAFLIVGLGASVRGLDEIGRPANANSLLAGLAAGLAAGLVAGVFVELLARVLLIPVFGRALVGAPLLASTFFTDADYVAGLSGRPNADGTALALTFANDDVAREFAAANVHRVVGV